MNKEKIVEVLKNVCYVGATVVAGVLAREMEKQRIEKIVKDSLKKNQGNI